MLLARTTSPSSIDRAFAQLSQSLVPSGSWAWRTAPSVHAVWRGENLELSVDLPGVPREAVSIDVAGRALTIAVEHRADHHPHREGEEERHDRHDIEAEGDHVRRTGL